MDAVARAKRTNRSALLREALEEKLKAAARKIPPSLFERSEDLSCLNQNRSEQLDKNEVDQFPALSRNHAVGE